MQLVGVKKMKEGGRGEVQLGLGKNVERDKVDTAGLIKQVEGGCGGSGLGAARVELSRWREGGVGWGDCVVGAAG